MKTTVLLLAGLLAVPSMFAQSRALSMRSASWSYDNNGGYKGFATFVAPPVPAVVANSCYSAELVSELVQTLADGTHVTQRSPATKVYRDSLGRTRTDSPMAMGFIREGTPETPLLVEILDPAAGVAYILDTVGKVAHRIAFDPAPQRRLPPEVSSLPFPPMPGADIKTAPLGTQVIEGVVAEGLRGTMTVPVGAQGNDRPLVNVRETWRSLELKTPVLIRVSTPTNGEQTTKLIHIDRTEPSPSLFQPPPDYKLVDEQGQFTIQYAAAK
jgi:hypothetical protein